jgi:predicted helicase
MNRGVYYTSPELVRYLVRATHELLIQNFGLSRGLADSRVTLLDPAAGTGTFVLGAAEEALAVEKSRGTASQRRLVREHLIPNFYGFELLPAPYAVAHLKLMSFYEQAGHSFAPTERVRVFLTNTLQVREEQAQLAFLPIVRGIV